MILKVDLDGVLYPFETRFRMFCELRLDRPLASPTHYRMWEDWNMSSDEFYDLLDTFVRRRFFRDGAPPKNAVRILTDLSKQYDIHIVTARAAVLAVGELKSYWEQDTVRWLEQYGIPHQGLHFLKKKYLLPGILIDDHMKNLEEAEAHGQRAICFDQPWNRDWTGERVTGWTALHKLLK